MLPVRHGAWHRAVRSPLVALFAVLALVLAGALAPVAAPAKAADLSQFDPGNIISDAVFYNSGAMSQSDIQSFLQAKESGCQSGSTCLKDYYDTTRTIGGDAMCSTYSGGGQERASAIIYKVAQACGVNPQVILVMLQKEQGLVTSTSPSNWGYSFAMGANCPDTTGCNGNSSGFFIQVYSGVWQLKRYSNPPGTSQYFTWFAPGNTWNIQYNPDANCGTKAVYIRNQATANLYYYTPYTPDAAALAAGYGTGDYCSSYGNRNFYNYFTDWFGSTQTPSASGSVAAPASLSSLDRDQYVLAADAGGTVWAYPISPAAVWGAPVAVATGTAGITALIPIGDIDGDGHTDLITIDASKTAMLHRGDGRTGFTAGTPLGVNWSLVRLVTAAGDANGDGVPDVYTVGPDGLLMLWRGNRDGGLAAPIMVGSGFGVVDLISGGLDLTGDGIPDLIARFTNGDLVLFPGDGHGGFGAGVRIGVGWSSMTAISAVRDATGDGMPDVIARDSQGRLLLYPNDGTGRLRGGGIAIGTGWQFMTAISTSSVPPTGARTRPAGAGDLNGDLTRDVVAVTSSGALALYPGDGHGGWKSPSTPVAQWGGEALVTLGDFTGDGHADLGTITKDGSFLLYPGDGAGGFGSPVVIGSGWGGMTAVIGGIDFDGDSKPDVIARTASGDLLLYRGNGAGGWAQGVGEVIGTGWNVFDTIIDTSDFDGDGRPDVMGRDSAGNLWLYRMSGHGGWLDSRQVGNGWGGFTALFSPGDFDGDGRPDILARASDGGMILYRGDGQGGWLGARTVGTGWNVMSRID